MNLLILVCLIASVALNIFLYKKKNEVFEKSALQLKVKLFEAWNALKIKEKARIIERIFFQLRTQAVLESCSYEKLIAMSDEELDGIFKSLIDSYVQTGTNKPEVIWAAVWLTDEVLHRLNSTLNMEQIKSMLPSLNEVNDPSFMEDILSTETPVEHIIDGLKDQKLQTLIRLLT